MGAAATPDRTKERLDRDAFDDFSVDTATHVLGSIACTSPAAWIRLGRLETRAFDQQVRSVSVQSPVFVCGLARAGSTLLLEYLAGHERVATHRYRDFPFLLTPCWWNGLLDRVPRHEAATVERAHRDGVFISPESPEGLEEMVWHAFFPALHDPSTSNALNAGTEEPAFERFYRDHIRKVLYVRGGRRYVAKNNYHVVRLAYLHRLFPDCRIVIPIREPSSHIASLLKQHRLFCRAQRRHPRARAYLRLMGHFEFGLDRRPINAGDTEATRQVMALLDAGDEIRGLARYWAQIYRYVWRLREENAAIRSAGLIVRFEDVCERPESVLQQVSSHCGLQLDSEAMRAFASRVRYPRYYEPSFTAGELDAIREETAEAAAKFGY